MLSEVNELIDEAISRKFVSLKISFGVFSECDRTYYRLTGGQRYLTFISISSVHNTAVMDVNTVTLK